MDGSDEFIKLKAVGQDGVEVHFKVKKSIKLQKLKKSYAERLGVNVESLRFVFDEERTIKDEDTPKMLKMKDCDVIDVFAIEQPGPREAPVATKSPEITDKQIKIKVVGLGNDVDFTVKLSTSMRKIKQMYCDKRGIGVDTIRFVDPNGHRIGNNDTPKKLEMEDGDAIEVFMEQTAGVKLNFIFF